MMIMINTNNEITIQIHQLKIGLICLQIHIKTIPGVRITNTMKFL